MAFTLQDLNDVLAGYRNPVWVGEIPVDIATAAGLSVTNVYLSRESAEHIFSDHPELDQFELLQAPMAIRQGLLVQEIKKPEIIIANYTTRDQTRRYAAIIKAAAGGTELWLCSFYRLRKRQTKSQLNRGRMLKKHD